jgi:cytochrome b6-f complex iron-sulfur subunit
MTDHSSPRLGRRSLLNRLAWGLLAASGAVGLGTVGRLLFPRVRFTPSTSVVLGAPGEFPLGVTERWKKSHGLLLVRGADGFYALRSSCTHLGCVPAWQAAQQKFKCPCHGSGFYKDGVNFEGPAPRPLERYAISLADDGQLEVDKSRTFNQEQGQWKDTASFVPV